MRKLARTGHQVHARPHYERVTQDKLVGGDEVLKVHTLDLQAKIELLFLPQMLAGSNKPEEKIRDILNFCRQHSPNSVVGAPARRNAAQPFCGRNRFGHDAPPVLGALWQVALRENPAPPKGSAPIYLKNA